MKHKGKAAAANLRIVILALVGTLAALAIGLKLLPKAAFLGFGGALAVLFLLFAVFCLNFFRDPDPHPPAEAKAIIAPGHGKVDFIGEAVEPEVMGGRCRRVSIFLSVFDVHIQNSPVAGKVTYLKHTPGQFLNALKLESAEHNENVLVGLESSEKPGEKIAVRLITGLIARRIVPWVALGDEVARGERISLIQFGSRVDLYLPLDTKVMVKLGDHVVGGATTVAERG